MPEQIDEFTRLDRELTGVSNALIDVDIEIKAATNEDKEVAEKIEDAYQAITDYGKRKANDLKNLVEE